MIDGFFHPAVSAWFEKRFTEPTDAQAKAWPSIRSRQHTLVAAPTGSGKTLAAFLAAIDDLVRQGQEQRLPDTTQVVYVSPLKALSNDIRRNLQQPLDGIRLELAARGFRDVEIRTFVRTGDTPASERQAMVRRPPHIVVTTPESLYILLTSRRGRDMLRTARTVIVDEIHAVVGSKRGSHLALTLERLDALAGRKLVRVGLSATQKPIDTVARFLVGETGPEAPECTILDTGHARRLDLAIELPNAPLEAVMSGDVWQEIYDRLADLVRTHRTTLVFVNTRRLAERVAKHLSDRLGSENVTSHHGSLAREQRLSAEQRLKNGQLSALVATASLELGIDIGDVDLVCQLGSTHSIATFLQRVGRSGHAVVGLPKGRLFPMSRDELIECAALFDAIGQHELDRIEIPEKPLDILAQQIVAMVACEEWHEDALYDRVRRAYPYRGLERSEFDTVVSMLAQGFTTRWGRRHGHIHRDGVNGRLRERRGARLTAITCGGSIPDTADYQVVLDPGGTVIGSLNEDFAIESMPGDIFQLGNASWGILRIEPGRVRVEDARGQPPTIPFWLGEAPSRTAELSRAVSRLRSDVADRLDGSETRLQDTRSWLVEKTGITDVAAEQIVDYLAASRAALGVMPSQKTLVLERFFDESGGMQLVLHAPFGSRINRAWGLALRKRFCRKFNFELQAAATEDAIVLSLGPTHSFPLEEVFHYLHSSSVRDVLVQALLDAPMFTVRWRWNVTRALAVQRFRGGKKVAAQLQRMNADDLLSLIFPDQVACVENTGGVREIPNHPLVDQTIHDCLEEAMDIRNLERLLAEIEAGQVDLVARDLTEPSPLAQEILNARPYAFLDDAPLEERRTRAVLSRRWLDPETASDLGALDPDAIERVRQEAWPAVESADELHDALGVLGFMTEKEGRNQPGGERFLQELVSDHRATVLRSPSGPALWITAERLAEFAALFPAARLDPPIPIPAVLAASEGSDPDHALVEIVRGRLEALGPTTSSALAEKLGLDESRIQVALLALESEGFALRGRFTSSGPENEWCDRRLLARMHRYTLKRLRAEIEPVSSSDFLRFLFEWQHLVPSERMAGAESLTTILEQLEGFEAPAAAWETEILPARLEQYDPDWLDNLCLSGRLMWMRLATGRRIEAELKTGNGLRAAHVDNSGWLLLKDPKQGDVLKTTSVPGSNGAGHGKPRARHAGPLKTTPIALLQRKSLTNWTWRIGTGVSPTSSVDAESVREDLACHGARFFDEIVASTGLLPSRVENALAELVSRGLVHSDSFRGLRALLLPSSDRRRGSRHRRRRSDARLEEAGRWVLQPHQETPDHPGRTSPEVSESIARILLKRYGVVFRRLLEREGIPPWRDLLRALHRLEARGEIRGGRFVAGFSGEQFALPEAVGMLRQVRRKPPENVLVSISASDPLNLLGIVTPGPRVPAISRNRVLYRDGMPLAIREAGLVRFLSELSPREEWETRKALVRRSVPSPMLAQSGPRGPNGSDSDLSQTSVHLGRER